MKKVRFFSTILSMILVFGLIVPCFTVFAEDAAAKTVSCDKDTYLLTDTISITVSGATNNDWVAIYPTTLAGFGGNYLFYYYAANNPVYSMTVSEFEELSASRRTPDEYMPQRFPTGDYVAILWENDGYTELDRAYFSIDSGKSFELDSTEYSVTDTISVTAYGTETKDWVGVYPDDGLLPGAGAQAAILWSYVPESEGVKQLAIDNKLEPGNYRAFLLENDGYTILDEFAFSVVERKTGEKRFSLNTSTVGKYGILAVTPYSTEAKDWVGIYPDDGLRPGAGAGAALKWIYLPENEGVKYINLNGELEPGSYRMYLLENDGVKNILDECAITVTDSDFRIDSTVYTMGATLVARYTYGSEKDWVGILPKGVVPGSGTNTYVWSYVSESGATALTLNSKFEVGVEYVAYLFQNEGYTQLGSAEFTVIEKVISKPANAPSSISYVRDADAPEGRADGTVTLLPGEEISEGVVLFWGDENGPLSDYTYFGYAGYDAVNENYVYEMTKGNLIPEGATRIYAYGASGNFNEHLKRESILSDSCISCEIGCDTISLPEPKYSFEVISDLHVTGPEDHENNLFGVTNNERVAQAFSDIGTNRGDTTCINVVGDLVNYGKDAEYEKLSELITEHLGDISINYTIGNHEFYDRGEAAGFEESWTAFRDFAGWEESDGCYRYKVINGDYHIYMGTEGYLEGADTAWGYFSETQRNWLKNLLAKAEKEGANAFVYMHQSIEETVSGSFASRGQWWSGVNDDALLREVMESYPNTFLFTGHSHWNLNSYGPFINGDADGASYFNCASAGYLWSDADASIPGSEGLHVDVYDGYVVVKGRDFDNQKWIPNVNVQVMLKDAPSAYIGEVAYEDVDEAVKNSTSGDTIELIRDSSLSEELPEGVKIKLCADAKLTAQENIYSALEAEILVAINKTEGTYTYITSDYSKDTIIQDGVQIRTSGKQGLRFIVKVDGAFDRDDFSDYGVIVIPTDMSDGANTTHETAQIADISKKALGDNFNYFAKEEDYFLYTVCIIDIEMDNYERDYTARPYFKYVSDGVEYTVYSEYKQAYNLSVYDTANGMIEDGLDTDGNIQKIVDEYNEYLTNQ